jgi:uncharacterized delta-60 repeat protein
MKAILSLYTLLCLVFCNKVSAQNLIPDATFGNNGIARHGFAKGLDEFYSMGLQSNGGIISGGITTNFTQDIIITRHNANGVLDAGFGDGGKFVLDIQKSSDMINSLIIQPDNKILVAGHTVRNNVRRGLIFRLNENGTLDQNFGEGGIVEFVGLSSSFFTSVQSIKLHSSGSIYIAGTSKNGTLDRAIVKKFTPNGVPDSSYAENSVATVVFGVAGSGNYGDDLAVLADGSVILFGSYFVNRLQCALAKLTPQGTFDTQFTGQGKTFFDFNTGQHISRKILMLPDDKFYLVAHCNASGGAYANYMGKFNANGTIDNTFGTNGRINFNTATGGNFVWDAVLANGNVFMVDYSYTGSTYQSNVHMLNEAGQRVSSFGTNGTFNLPTVTSYGYGIAISGSDVYYCGSQFRAAPRNAYSGIICKLGLNGQLNSNFGANGQQFSEFSKANTTPKAMYKLSNGDIITIGTSTNTSTDQYAAKYKPNGTLDNTFGNNGSSTVNLGGTELVMDVVPLANGEAVVLAERGNVTLNFTGLGSFTAPGNYSLMRLLPNSGLQSAGATNTNINSSEFTRGLKVKQDANGKFIVLANSTTANQRAGYLLRHNANLTLDNSFGNAGNGRIMLHSLSFDEFTFDFIIAPDGKFITLASTSPSGFILRKWDASGSQDVSFGQLAGIAGGGISTYSGQHTDGTNHAQPRAIYSYSGGIYVLGIRGANNYAVAKLTANGILQSYMSIGSFNTINGLLVENDGSFIAYGTNNNDKWLIRKFDATGAPVTSFADNGTYTVTAFDDISTPAFVLPEADSGLLLLSGQRTGIFGSDNTLLKLTSSTTSNATPAEQANIVVFPNPNAGNSLFVKAPDSYKGLETITFTDWQGKRTVVKPKPQYGDISSEEVLWPTNFKPGIYFVEFTFRNGTQTVEKLIKQ